LRSQGCGGPPRARRLRRRQPREVARAAARHKADTRHRRASPRGRAIAGSSAYNKVLRGPPLDIGAGPRKCSSRKQAQMLNSLDLEGSPQDTRVVVAMSGGVDSSVTAALLKAEGYDVVGVTLQLYDHGAATHRKGACCAGQDIYDARAVAERIGIPHYVLDYESRFKEMVIDRF